MFENVTAQDEVALMANFFRGDDEGSNLAQLLYYYDIAYMWAIASDVFPAPLQVVSTPDFYCFKNTCNLAIKAIMDKYAPSNKVDIASFLASSSHFFVSRKKILSVIGVSTCSDAISKVASIAHGWSVGVTSHAIAHSLRRILVLILGDRKYDSNENYSLLFDNDGCKYLINKIGNVPPCIEPFPDSKNKIKKHVIIL